MRLTVFALLLVATLSLLFMNGNSSAEEPEPSEPVIAPDHDIYIRDKHFYEGFPQSTNLGFSFRNQPNSTIRYNVTWYIDTIEGLRFNKTSGSSSLVPGETYGEFIAYDYLGGFINDSYQVTFIINDDPVERWDNHTIVHQANITTIKPSIKLDVAWSETELDFRPAGWGRESQSIMVEVINSGNVDISPFVRYDMIDRVYGKQLFDFETVWCCYINLPALKPGENRTLELKIISGYYHDEPLMSRTFELNYSISGFPSNGLLQNAPFYSNTSITINILPHNTFRFHGGLNHHSITPSEWQRETFTIRSYGNIPANITIHVENPEVLGDSNIKYRIQPETIYLPPYSRVNFYIDFYVSGLYRTGDVEVIVNATSMDGDGSYSLSTGTLMLNGPSAYLIVGLPLVVVMSIIIVIIHQRRSRS